MTSYTVPTLPTALAAPVEEGMMFWAAPRPPRQSLPLGPSTVFWVAVVACTVVIRPSMIPYLSLITLARGARQLVVQEALETTLRLGSYFSWLTPITNMGASADGAEMTTWILQGLGYNVHGNYSSDLKDMNNQHNLQNRWKVVIAII